MRYMTIGMVIGGLIFVLCNIFSDRTDNRQSSGTGALISRKIQAGDAGEVKNRPILKGSIRSSPKQHSLTTNGTMPRMYMGLPVVRVETSTNSAGYLVERLYTADGKRHKFTHYPPPVFKHASDSYLAMALSVPAGAEMAPLPDLSNEGGLDKAFMESLKEDIFIEEGDSERVKDLKVKVVAARETMKALLKDGYSFFEVLEETRKNINENVELRSQMTAQYHDLLQKGFSEDAESLRIKVNKVFAEMGIEDIQPRRPQKNN
ncbi:MAG: hypothetical protein J6R18_04145 [Kiritimatiellae bacterium]|nr:hypothetical protein [Kiritimatiellia bacterium]